MVALLDYHFREVKTCINMTIGSGFFVQFESSR